MMELGTASGGWRGARLAAIAGTVTVCIGLVPVAAAASKADPGPPENAPNGGPGPQGNPGSERAQEVRSQHEPEPASPKAQPRGSAKPKPGNPGRRAHGAPPKQQPAHARPAPAAPPQAKAGKTTICHSTGSSTNPYVEITISNNALKAHARHHDGRDVIPAPAGGCPVATTTTAAGGFADVLGRTRARERDSVAATGRGETTDRERGQGEVLSARATDEAGTVPALAEEEVAGGGGDDSAELPFTGLALLAILAAAAVALGGGFAARRAAQRT